MSEVKKIPYQCFRTYMTIKRQGMWAFQAMKREKVTVLAISGEVAFIKKGRDKAKCCDVSQLGKPIAGKECA